MIFDLDSIVLLATQSDQQGLQADPQLFYVAIGSFAAVIAIAISSVFSFLSERRERNSTLLDSLQGFSSKLADLTAKEGLLKTKADCESYAWNYLDIVDAIAYMYERKIIPHGVIDYFDNNFLYALLLREWLLENRIRDELPPENETWFDLINFCKQYKMATFNSKNRMEMNYDKEKERLPYAMQDYLTLPDYARVDAKNP